MSISYGGDYIQDTDGGVLRPSSSVMRNRIINGAMVIDQRNAGASVTQTTTFVYPVDRFGILGTVASKFTAQQNAGSVTPPAGFVNYLGCTSSSAYTVGASEAFTVRQNIEGYNIADLGWGTANAKTVTLSFWVRSSLTGTFGGSLANSGGSRTYPFSYSIPVENTWTQITLTIAGDTTGTWLTTIGQGILVRFSLGAGATVSGTAGSWSGSTYVSTTGATSVVGTSGATWYITGVQLEVGTSATGFEYRQYQQELALCQRYYYRTVGSNNSYLGMGQVSNVGTTAVILVPFPVTMRVVPSSLDQTGTASNYKMSQASTANVNCSAVPTLAANSTAYMGGALYTASTLGGTAGQITMGSTDGTGYLGFSAEL